MIQTACLMETMYLLKRGFLSRGLRAFEEGRYNLNVYHQYGKFSVSLFPGNRRILISHGSLIASEERGKGHGRRMLRLRQDVAREAGINLLLATVRDDNRQERKLLRKAGWFVLAPRPETGVSMWAKRLRR